MKTLTLLVASFFFTFAGFSQDSEKNEIESLKIAFITDALNMSAAMAQKFWPVYNKYENQGETLRSNMHCMVYDQLDELQHMPDSEAEKLLKNYMELRTHEHELRKAYVAELQKVISAKEIMMLKKAEYDFHKKLLKEYRSGNKGEKVEKGGK